MKIREIREIKIREIREIREIKIREIREIKIREIREIREIKIREIKHRVYGKRQTWICTTWPSFPFYLLFTVHYNYTKIGKFTPILSIRIVLSCCYLLISHFENFPTWISRLLFAVHS